MSHSWRLARKLRIEYPGAVYHVMNPGDRRETTFGDDPDAEVFLSRPLASPEAGLSADRKGDRVKLKAGAKPPADLT